MNYAMDQTNDHTKPRISASIEEQKIGAKRVFAFEPHNLAPIAWKTIGEEAEQRPALVTLDRHTDTRLAFLKYLNGKQSWGVHTPPYAEKIQHATAECVRVRTDADWDSAVLRLRNDEHIDFAIRAGLLSHAYVISHETNPQFVMRSRERQAWDTERFRPENLLQGIVPPRPEDRTYDLPENRIICLGNDHLDSLGARTDRQKIDLSLEDANLTLRLEEIERLNAILFPDSGPVLDSFILDIDLDYFNTMKSINPDQPSVFYELVRRCIGITIAKESSYVDGCRLDGETLTSSTLLARMREHIAAAQD